MFIYAFLLQTLNPIISLNPLLKILNHTIRKLSHPSILLPTPLNRLSYAKRVKVVLGRFSGAFPCLGRVVGAEEIIGVGFDACFRFRGEMIVGMMAVIGIVFADYGGATAGGAGGGEDSVY